MENITACRLTPAQAQARQAESDRRAAYMERQNEENQEYVARILDLYANGSMKRAQPAPAPQFKEAEKFTVVKLAGGAKASTAAKKGAKRVLDMSAEAVAKREQRRARRLARKARQAAG